MSDQTSERIRYPEQDVLALSESDGRLVLTEVGVPRDHLLFGANESLRREVTASGRTCLRIGEVGSGDGLFVDEKSGEILFIGAHDGNEWHVNRSLRQFIQSLDLFEDSYLFYGANSAIDVREAAVSQLRAALTTVDPTSTRDEPGFWNTVLFDVGVGDYADEAS